MKIHFSLLRHSFAALEIGSKDFGNGIRLGGGYLWLVVVCEYLTGVKCSNTRIGILRTPQFTQESVVVQERRKAFATSLHKQLAAKRKENE